MGNLDKISNKTHNSARDLRCIESKRIGTSRNPNRSVSSSFKPINDNRVIKNDKAKQYPKFW